MSEDQRDGSVSFDGAGSIGHFCRTTFGDRLGLLIFLGSCSLFAIYWIADWRITDSLTLLNTLHALADGSLHYSEPMYGSSLQTPGVTEIDGRAYGRNYGILVVSLLPLAIFRLLGAVGDLRIVVAGLWVLGLLAMALVAGQLVGRREEAARWGSVGALVLFVISVAVATDLDPTRGELYALQFTHLVIAGFVAVFLYRLLARIHGRHVGLFGAALLVLGTPLGLWATVPKRHVVTALVFVVTGYALYRSRESAVAGTREEVLYRGAGYAAIGLLAWVHAPEAIALLVVFGVVDLLTAPRRDLPALTGIALAFFLSLVPFFVTNTVAFGSPVTPPRLVSGATDLSGATSGGAGGSSGTATTIPIVTPLIDTFDPVLTPLTHLSSLFGASIDHFRSDPSSFWDVFVRSGTLDRGWAAEQANYEAVNLSVIESGPVVVAIVGAVVASGKAMRNWVRTWSIRARSPVRILDAYTIAFALAISLLYFHKLPLHAQVTARYLLPMFPALVYGVLRIPAVRSVVRDHAKTFVWTVSIGVLIGGQFVVLALAIVEPARGEAFQFHALLGLATATPLAAWALAGRSDGWWGRAGAVLFGLACAATTVFLLVLTLDYWSMTNGPGLPLIRTMSEIVSFL